MNKTFILLGACALMATACNKSHVPASVPSDDHGCIERGYTDKNSPGLSPADIKLVDLLMTVNHLDYSRLRYYDYKVHASPNGRFTQVILADQYVNGRRIFNAGRSFVFANGVLEFETGKIITSGDPVKRESLTLTQLRSLFTRDILQIYGVNLQHLVDSCYRAEYGYYNVAGEYAKPQLVGAWLVTLRSYDRHGNILAGYYHDTDGRLLGFSGKPVN
jgi:hypothetical protein